MAAPDRETTEDTQAIDAAACPDVRLLELLVCPLTKTTLHYDAARQELVSRAARLAFPIIDGMPVLVASEARALDDAEVHGRR